MKKDRKYFEHAEHRGYDDKVILNYQRETELIHNINKKNPLLAKDKKSSKVLVP